MWRCVFCVPRNQTKTLAFTNNEYNITIHVRNCCCSVYQLVSGNLTWQFLDLFVDSFIRLFSFKFAHFCHSTKGVCVSIIIMFTMQSSFFSRSSLVNTGIRWYAWGLSFPTGSATVATTVKHHRKASMYFVHAQILSRPSISHNSHFGISQEKHKRMDKIPADFLRSNFAFVFLA